MLAFAVAVAACAVVTVVLMTLSKASKAMQKAARSSMKISEITIYPVKSCAGVSVAKATLDAKCGLSQDRLWMVVDARGAFVSQRRAPKLALVRPSLPASAAAPLELSAPGVAPITVPVVDAGAPRRTVRCWDDKVEAVDQGDAVAEWLVAYLGDALRGARLVRMPRSSKRVVDQKYAPRGAQTAFSDGFPVLLASTASLADLNAKIISSKGGADDDSAALPMNRFRPNVVVDGADAWAEDAWTKVCIGSEAFLVAKPCARCKMPTIDQATGIPGGEKTAASRSDDDDEGGGPNKGVEPTATLKTFRTGKLLGYKKASWESDVFFGQNLCHLPLLPWVLDVLFGEEKAIKVGDGLAVLQ